VRRAARCGSALVAPLVCLALLLPACALAQGGGGSPSAGELWRQYPLDPRASAGQSTGATTTPPATTAPRAATEPRAAQTSPPRAAESSSSGTPLPLILGLVAVTMAFASAALVLHTRRTRPAREAAAHDLEPAPRTQEVPMTEHPTPAPTPRAARPPDPAAAWTAEIAWQQAPGRCRFCAVAAADDGADRAPVMCSAWLDWPPTERSPVTALGQAVADLERSLGDAGWEPLEPGDAWYAKRFGWTPVGSADAGPTGSADLADGSPDADDGELESFVVPRRFVRVPAWPEGSEDRWRCEIRWDASRRDARFRAVAAPPGDGDGGRRVGESAPVSSPFTGDGAVRGLEHALLQAGWERAGRGPEWYSQRFVWPGEGEPPARVEPAVHEGT
jgi:hypothetical protein